ncbi:MAG: GNAT family N-acetyltransferase [Cyanobacteria bacterium J06600_6]
MKIEEIAAKDLRLISQLFIDVFCHSPWNEYWEFDWAYERLSWIYNAPGFAGYIARDKKILVGAILGHFVPFQGKKGFQLVEFLVRGDCQNQGVGSQLLKRLESHLRQDNCDFVFLLTAKDSNAESFYAKHHYQRDRKIVLLNKEL